ncbi:hypothetical protein EAI_15852 [Harpegnathos saltator]|uniref:Uncharacterized protein n=1 Tax=Harpegnathos saltator TaxID=610380 RepID=E2BMZ4_HARSA|nr:hypothetical protein EAI_15852 [Harpegnathos saltator]
MCRQPCLIALDRKGLKEWSTGNAEEPYLRADSAWPEPDPPVRHEERPPELQLPLRCRPSDLQQKYRFLIYSSDINRGKKEKKDSTSSGLTSDKIKSHTFANVSVMSSVSVSISVSVNATVERTGTAGSQDAESGSRDRGCATC